MKKTVLTTSILSLVVVASCRKDMPLPPSDVAPEFYAHASIDGVQTNFGAGIDDYYMFTDYEVIDGIPHYLGKLKPSTGTGEGWSIRFRGNDQGQEASIDSSFALGNHTLHATQARNYIPGEVRITTQPLFLNELYQSYVWSFQFGGPTLEITPTFTLDTVRFTRQPVTTLTTKYESGRNAHTSRCVDTRYPDAISYFDITQLNDTEFRLYVPNDEFSKMDEVGWKIDGVDYGKGQYKSYTLVGSSQTIEVEVYFQHSNGAGTCMTRTLELSANGPDPSMVDFNYTVGQNYTLDSIQYNSLELSYTTPQGKTYSTALHPTPGQVEIQEVIDYQNDVDGRPTKKVRLTGSFLLKDASGDEMRIDDADFVIAVATRD